MTSHFSDHVHSDESPSRNSHLTKATINDTEHRKRLFPIVSQGSEAKTVFR